MSATSALRPSLRSRLPTAATAGRPPGPAHQAHQGSSSGVQPTKPHLDHRPPPRPPPTPPTVMTTFPAHLRPGVLANGLLLVDKPVGWEVAEVVAAVQRATRAAKVASVAPLDPGASGLVLLCFGAATRLAAAVERAGKEYEGSLVLGGAAESADVRGPSFREGWMPWGHIADDEELQEAADSLLLTAAEAQGRHTRTKAITEETAVEGEASGAVGGAAAEDTAEDTAEAAAGGGGGGGGGGVLQVLPPRHKALQLPGSTSFVEEDVGPSVITSPLQVRSFRVWGWRGEEGDRPEARTAPSTAEAPPTSDRGGGGGSSSGGLLMAAAAGSSQHQGGVRVPVTRPPGNPGSNPVDRSGRTVRFSVELAGRIQVRSLVAMYGRRLRTTACLNELRRTAVAGLSVDDAWALESLLPLLQHYQR